MQRKRRATNEPLFDEDTQLSQAELDRWITDYAVNMAKATKARRRREASSLARRNAAYWVFGVGIGGVDAGIGSSKLKSPLDIFTGNALKEVLTGSESSPAGGNTEVEALTAKRSSPVGRKREMECPGMKELSPVRRKKKLKAPTASKYSLTDDDFDDATTLKRQRKPELLTPLVSPDSREATTGHRSTTNSCSPSVATQDISEHGPTAADLCPPNVHTGSVDRVGF